MDDGTPNEPLFRANKRRKVFRKRAEAEEEADGVPDLNNDGVRISNHAESTEDGSTGALRVKRKATNRSHGIGFTSTEGRKDAREDRSEEMAMVLASMNDGQEAPGSERFVKPTGRVAVTEDKHMMAYIDSKLAEARSPTPPVSGDATDSAMLANNDANGTTVPATNASRSTGEWTIENAPARSTKTYQRPTKRRPKPARDQADVARDSMIDQIMQESSVPLYTQPVSTSGGNDVDNDAATAEAFKAQLLLEFEVRRPRLAPKGVAKDAKAPTGPKLGGSRSQREKMKALEEAAKGGGGAKK